MRAVLTFLLGLSLSTALAQNRYFDEVFAAADSTTGIVYGQNQSWNNTAVSLALDIYEPAGDTAGKRPLMLFVHGGSFIGGVRNDPFMRDLCISFAKRGYVTATISYRLGVNTANLATIEQEFIKATLRSMQDVKAAVRFLRRSADAEGNPYGIDTSRILLGGYSAGSIAAIHTALLTDTNAASPLIRQMLQEVGGLEGMSGNNAYSSRVHGLFNMAGAIADTSLVTTGGVPALHIHGTADQTVPFGRGYAQVSGFPVVELYGSSLLHARMLHRNYQSLFTVLQGAGHDIASSPSIRATVKEALASFAYSFMNNTLSLPENSLPGVKLYPNPAAVRVQLEGLPENSLLQVYDMQGRLKISQSAGTHEEIDLQGWQAGVYLLRVQQGNRATTRRLVVR